MPPAQIDEKTRKQIAGLRKLLQGVNAVPESSDKPTGKPTGWETYKDMKAAWILSSDKLPGAVQDDMREVGDYVRKLHEESKNEPAPDEIVEEYVLRVSGKSFAVPTPSQEALGDTLEERMDRVDLATEKLSPDASSSNEENEEIEKELKLQLPEAVLSKWDEALVGTVKQEPKKIVSPLKVVPTVAVKKTFTVPKKPSPEVANYMREAATPTVVGRVG